MRMRAILLLLILAVVALIAAVATGLLDIGMTQPARAPNVDAAGRETSARGAQVPTFDIETGSVSVGAAARNVTVPVPTLEVTPPNEKAAAQNSSEQQPQRQ